MDSGELKVFGLNLGTVTVSTTYKTYLSLTNIRWFALTESTFLTFSNVNKNAEESMCIILIFVNNVDILNKISKK